MSIGERLKLLRENLGYNKREASEQLGMPYTTYNNYETDARDVGSETLRKIAQFYDVTIDYILENERVDITKLIDERNIIEKYRNLDDRGKENVYAILNVEYQRRCGSDKVTSSEHTDIVKEEPSHLMPIAAHNDYADDPEEQRLMQKDLDEL